MQGMRIFSLMIQHKHCTRKLSNQLWQHCATAFRAYSQQGPVTAHSTDLMLPKMEAVCSDRADNTPWLQMQHKFAATSVPPSPLWWTILTPSSCHAGAKTDALCCGPCHMCAHVLCLVAAVADAAAVRLYTHTCVPYSLLVTVSPLPNRQTSQNSSLIHITIRQG